MAPDSKLQRSETVYLGSKRFAADASEKREPTLPGQFFARFAVSG